MTPTYDLVLLLDPEAESDRREQILRDVEGAISSQGSLVGRHDWGDRHLSYPIGHRRDADFHLFQFTGPSELIDSLRRSLKLADGVLRSRIIRLAPGTPPPPPSRPAAAAAPRAEEQPQQEA